MLFPYSHIYCLKFLSWLLSHCYFVTFYSGCVCVCVLWLHYTYSYHKHSFSRAKSSVLITCLHFLIQLSMLALVLYLCAHKCLVVIWSLTCPRWNNPLIFQANFPISITDTVRPVPGAWESRHFDYWFITLQLSSINVHFPQKSHVQLIPFPWYEHSSHFHHRVQQNGLIKKKKKKKVLLLPSLPFSRIFPPASIDLYLYYQFSLFIIQFSCSRSNNDSPLSKTSG